LETLYNIVFVIAIIIAAVFAALIFLTSKGDAMSGGSNVRTTFKGKAGFDDFVSRLVIYLAIAFVSVMIVMDALSGRVPR
jgi:preprotein translocase subunit SecG